MTAWLEEARHLLRLSLRDYQTFGILVDSGRAELAPTCFHAQQAAEKALKSVLTLLRQDFPRTHQLTELARLVVDAGGMPPLAPEEYLPLTPFAVELRYDDVETDLMTREQAGRVAKQTLDWATQQVDKAAG